MLKWLDGFSFFLEKMIFKAHVSFGIVRAFIQIIAWMPLPFLPPQTNNSLHQKPLLARSTSLYMFCTRLFRNKLYLLRNIGFFCLFFPLEIIAVLLYSLLLCKGAVKFHSRTLLLLNLPAKAQVHICADSILIGGLFCVPDFTIVWLLKVK